MKSIAKSVYICLTLLALLSTCKSQKSAKTESSVESFTTEFEQSVLTHKPEEILKFMTNSYVKEQHDEFLEGRTKQFLNEFFCGKTEENPSKFKCVNDISQIKEIVRVSLTPTSYGLQYVF